ncbi:hypothetical protein Droror1_Dr00011792 [Drosera rotundifolia]
MALIMKFKQKETKAPKRGRKQERGAMKSAYLEGCVFALLHLDGKILKPTKIVRLPKMFLWEDKKAPSNFEATNKLFGKVVETRVVRCLDLLERDFNRGSKPKIIRRRRKKREERKDVNEEEKKNVKEINVTEDNMKKYSVMEDDMKGKRKGKGNGKRVGKEKGKGKGKGKGKEKEKEKNKE